VSDAPTVDIETYEGSLPEGVEARAAYIMADLFATTVLRGLDQHPRREWLYCWERGALAWLKDWRTRDPRTPINAWTQTYMDKGPPPWR
jgi:hypothetical protein